MRCLPLVPLAISFWAGTPVPAQDWLLGPEQKLVHPDWVERDKFGCSIAAQDDVLVVGAMDHDHAGQPSWIDAGAAYVYRLGGGGWQLEAELLPFDAPNHVLWNWSFGEAVAIDGDTIAIGAYYHDGQCPNDPVCDSGAVYVFRRVAGAWTPEQLVVPSDLAQGDLFGSSVALEGDLLFIGSPYDSDQGTHSGSVYVFERNGSTWTEVQKLSSSPAAAYSDFGDALSVEGDVLVVGAYRDDRGGTWKTDDGRAFVFRRVGGAWSQEALLEADGYGGNTRVHFGRSVSISGDSIAVGAPGRSTSEGQHNGAVFVFDHVGGVWERTAKLTLSDQLTEEHFGAAVCLLGDRLVGGKEGSAGVTEHAYVFERAGGSWTPVLDFRPNSFKPWDTSFAAALWLTADHIFAGAWREYVYEGSNNYPQVGAAYVFDIESLNTYCTSTANSTGSPAGIKASGSRSLFLGDLTLYSSPVPNQPSLFIHAPDQAQLPFGNGFLCISGSIVRSATVMGSGNLAVYTYDGSDNKHDLAPFLGTTRHFQHWYRDPMAGGAGFNTSDGLSVTILP